MLYLHRDYLRYEIPDGWEMEEADDGSCYSIYNPEGNGALTLSFYTLLEKPTNMVERVTSMASSFISQTKLSLQGTLQKHLFEDKKVVLSGEDTYPDWDYVKLWFIAKFPKVVCATYIAEEKTAEVIQYDALIDSMTFLFDE